MQHGSLTTSSQKTTAPEGTHPLSNLKTSSVVACEVRKKNKVTYRSPHLREQISYIDNPAFHQPEAWRAFIDASSKQASGSPCYDSQSSDDRLAPLMRYPILHPAEATQLILKMNFLKFRAIRELQALGEAIPSPEQLTTVTNLLAEAKEIKDLIVLSNVRLAVKATQAFITTHLTADDLISHGLESLMKCTDGFDCSKGFQFSTYVTVALRGVYNRAARDSKTQQLSSLSDEYYSLDPADKREDSALSEVNQAYLHKELSASIAQLTSREQLVITERFLKEKFLREISNIIGISKEGTRLAVGSALNRLRQVMSLDPRDNLL